jgi:hypothetical protein
MVLRAVVILGALALFGCGGAATTTSTAPPLTQLGHGLGVRLPAGWQAADTNLTPHLGDPREEMSVGTFPLRYRPSRCSQFPSGTLEGLGPGDAFVTLQERGRDPSWTWPDFPPRPARFGPELGGGSEVEQCVPSVSFADHWFAFTDAGRHFDTLVVFGSDASADVRAQAWSILDSLQVDPRVEPDWHASP